MPGAGCGRAAGFLAKIAPKDGTVIAGIMPGAVMGPLLEDKPEILFDPVECNISAPPTTAPASASAGRRPASRASTTCARKEVPFGAVSPNESTHDYAYMLAPHRRREIQDRLRL